MGSRPLAPSRTTCASLLHELQIIWDEIGESDDETDKILLQLEQECLDIYRTKVDLTKKYRAELQQFLADAESEIAYIVSSLGETTPFCRIQKGTLKQQISDVRPVLEDLRLKKQERVKQFYDTERQIACICAQIAGTDDSIKVDEPEIDEHDLTLKRLGVLMLQLKELQNEKSLRSQKVVSDIATIHELSAVMSTDFFKTLDDVHPSQSDYANAETKNISNNTLARLTSTIDSIKQEKQQRLQKVQGLANTLIKLWDLMDTPVDERKRFEHVTTLISCSVDEVSRPGCLAFDVIEQTEVEAERLNALKASKMRDLVFKRQKELEEIYRGVHMDVDSDGARQILINLMESGDVDLSALLSSMDDQITKAKEQALSRKDILDKIEKWKFASEEERWLDDYEKDENRYTAGKGAHKNLKRAEKARILVGKIPGMVKNLTAKVEAWELEKGIPFLYCTAPFLSTLDEYREQRQEREEDKRRSREQKRLQEQFAAEQEALYGSRPTTKKPLGQSTSGNNMIGTPAGRRGATPSGRYGISAGKERRESRVHNVIPINYVALHKEDSASLGS